MPTTIKLKSNSTAGVAPSAGSLTHGELAINTTDGLLFTKNTAAGVVPIQGKPQGSDTQLQFNDAGFANGSAGLTFSKSTNTVAIGNSTVNSSINSSSFGLANSTVTFRVTLPTAAQNTAGNYFLGANGVWQQVTGGSGGDVYLANNNLFTGNNTFGGTNTVFNSNVTFNGAVFNLDLGYY